MRESRIARRKSPRFVEHALLPAGTPAELSIDEETNHRQRHVGDADHQIDAVVVGPRKADLVFCLRTGVSGHGLRSGRTGTGRPRRCQQHQEQTKDKD